MVNIHKDRKIKTLIILFLTYIIMSLSSLFINLLSNTSLADDSVQQNNLSSAERNRTLVVKLEEETQICLEFGKELFFEQKYQDAIKQLEQCLSQEPDNPEIYYYIGQSYFEQGQLSAQKKNIISATKYYRQAYQISEIAIEKYLNLIEKFPDNDHTNDYLRLAYIYEIRSYAPGVNEFQKAIDIYEKLLETKPYLNYAHYHLGWIYYQQAEYQKAIEKFLSYLKPGYKSDFVYYYLGLSYDKIKESEKARYYFQLILDEFPNSKIVNYAKKELKN